MLLVTAGANVNAKDDETKSTPLHLAVQQDNQKAVEALTKFPHCEVNSQVYILLMYVTSPNIKSY